MVSLYLRSFYFTYTYIFFTYENLEGFLISLTLINLGKVCILFNTYFFLCSGTAIPPFYAFSFEPFQAGPRGDGRECEHASGHPHGPGALRRPGPGQVAVRRLVQRCHAGESHGERRYTRVSLPPLISNLQSPISNIPLKSIDLALYLSSADTAKVSSLCSGRSMRNPQEFNSLCCHGLTKFNFTLREIQFKPLKIPFRSV